MYAERFSPLIHKHPREADALARLEAFFRAHETEGTLSRLRLEPQRMFQLSQAGSASRLAQVIALLISEHLIQRLIVVESPGGGGIETFHSYDDVPDFIHDTRRDVQLEVTPDVVKTYYKPWTE